MRSPRFVGSWRGSAIFAMLGLLVVTTSAVCGDDSASRARAMDSRIGALQAQIDTLQAQAQTDRPAADLGQITQLEATFHKATTIKDLDLVMTIFADDANMISADTTFTGKEAIRASLSMNVLFKPETRWIALTIAQKFRIEVQGDRGMFYFECHYFDLDKNAFASDRAVTTTVVRTGGRWLIKEWRAAAVTLTQ